MYAVMYRKKGEAAYGFSDPLTEADAERAARRYRRLGYDAVHVSLPT